MAVSLTVYYHLNVIVFRLLPGTPVLSTPAARKQIFNEKLRDNKLPWNVNTSLAGRLPRGKPFHGCIARENLNCEACT